MMRCAICDKKRREGMEGWGTVGEFAYCQEHVPPAQTRPVVEKPAIGHADLGKVFHELDAQAKEAQKDPWKHRSSDMICSTCMWYVAKAPNPDMHMTRYIGRCRRHSPRMEGYPAVYPNDWCGDHKVDETKI